MAGIGNDGLDLDTQLAMPVYASHARSGGDECMDAERMHRNFRFRHSGNFLHRDAQRDESNLASDGADHD